MRRTKRSIAALVALVGSAVVISMAVVHQTRCDGRCSAAVVEADRLAATEDLRGALTTIDEADAQCGCGAEVDGDEPEEYASARAYFDRLVARGREDEARDVVAHARGPILREFARTMRR